MPVVSAFRRTVIDQGSGISEITDVPLRLVKSG
jgi:hypothetical protein